MKKPILIILMFSVLLSCAATAKSKKSKDNIPDWYKNPKSVYPAQMYLTAIGTGDSGTDAENDAAANISKIFESVVKTEQTVDQRYSELIKGDDITVEDQMSIDKKVYVQAGQTLFNLQFAERFTDKKGQVHVLAYLHRIKTADIYEEKINENAKRILYFAEQSNNKESVLKKYAFMNAAGVVSIANQTLLEQLQIIYPDALSFLELNYEHNEIMQQNAELAKKVTFRIGIENDPESKVTAVLEQMLTESGFVLSDNPELMITGKTLFENTNLKRDDGFKFVRYNFDLKITDSENNIIVSAYEKGKEGHTTHFEAKERCIRKIAKKINKSMKKKITAYFDGLVTTDN